MTNSPVLFLIFNRFETTKLVFKAIREAKPRRLYIACDGPRPSRPLELGKICEVRDFVLKSIDWPCEVKTLFREENLGCKLAVSQAITWFFENEPAGIILEDDCLPAQSFFTYCDELLQRYGENDQIMCISGDGTIGTSWQPEESYWFSKYSLIWGWATWRRAWKHYEVNIEKIWKSDGHRILNEQFPESNRAKKFWGSIFKKVAENKIDTWDYQWTLACWLNNGLTCVPKTNLISNLGFGLDATHTIDSNCERANSQIIELKFPLKHPQISYNSHGDNVIKQVVFGIDERSRIIRIASKILKCVKC